MFKSSSVSGPYMRLKLEPICSDVYFVVKVQRVLLDCDYCKTYCYIGSYCTVDVLYFTVHVCTVLMYNWRIYDTRVQEHIAIPVHASTTLVISSSTI